MKTIAAFALAAALLVPALPAVAQESRAGIYPTASETRVVAPAPRACTGLERQAGIDHDKCGMIPLGKVVRALLVNDENKYSADF